MSKRHITSGRGRKSDCPRKVVATLTVYDVDGGLMAQMQRVSFDTSGAMHVLATAILGTVHSELRNWGLTDSEITLLWSFVQTSPGRDLGTCDYDRALRAVMSGNHEHA